MMKLRITTRNLPGSTNCNRVIPSNTLLPKRRNRIQKSKTYLPRCKLWMTITNTTCQRRVPILRMYLFTHWTKYILWIIQLYTHMISGSRNPNLNLRNSLSRICTTMRTNIILRCNCNYKLIISNSIRRYRSSTMSMRRVCSRQRHTNTILRFTLLVTIRNYSNSNNSPSISTPNRIKQSTRTK